MERENFSELHMYLHVYNIGKFCLWITSVKATWVVNLLVYGKKKQKQKKKV